jgi:hypothetical protein
VQDRDATGSGQDDWQAIGDEDEPSQTGLGDDVSIRLRDRIALLIFVSRVKHQLGAMDLPGNRDSFGG